jgi:hypothetical protein
LLHLKSCEKKLIYLTYSINKLKSILKWSDVGLLLTEVKKNVQGALVNMTTEVNTSGISTPTGLRGLNLDGQLFSQATDGAESKMQEQFDQAYKLQTLSHLWNLQVSRTSPFSNQFRHHVLI